jgi:NADH:ubiquinone oxidoreductase subunit 6 (subunit J)
VTLHQILFGVISIVVIGSALVVVTTRNLFHAALFLVLSFFGVAGFYVLLDSGFFAVAQVLVYIGAISILMVFAVMLTRGMAGMPRYNSNARVAAIVAGLSFVVMLLIFSDSPFLFDFPSIFGRFDPGPRVIGGVPWPYVAPNTPVPPTYIADFGRALVDIGGFVLPFMLAAVLLDIALAGAIHIARERRTAEVMEERKQLAAEEAADREIEAGLANKPGNLVPEAAHVAESH